MRRRAFLFLVAVLGLCAPLLGQVDTLTLGEPLEATIPAVDQSNYYRLDLASPIDLVLTIRNANDSGERFRVYLQVGELPTPNEHLAGSEADRTEQVLDVPGLASGTYYVQVLYAYDPWPWGDSGDYRILAQSREQLPPLLLGDVQEAGIAMIGQAHYYRLDLPSDAELVLTVRNANDSDERSQLHLQEDRLPTPSDYLAWSNADGTEQVLDVPGLSAGTYYVRVFYAYDPWPWGDSGDYRILAQSREQLPPLLLGDVQEAGIAMIGQSHYYRLDLASAADLFLMVSNANDSGERFEVYIQTDRLPTASDYLAGSYTDGTEQKLDLPGLPAGTYYVRVFYAYDPWPWGDSGDYRILCGALGSTVAQVTPRRLGNAGLATLTVRGSGLYEGVTVRLARAGFADLIPLQTTRVASHQLRAQFNLQGVEPGWYDVVVSNPAGDSATVPDAVEIIRGGAAQPWVDIIGSPRLRPGRLQTYSIRCGNSGEVDTHDMLLWVELPLEVDVISTDLPHPDDDSIDWGAIPVSFDTEEARIVPIWLLHVPLGASNGFRMTVVARGGQAHQKATIRLHLAQADSDFAMSGSLDDIEHSPVFVALAEAIVEVLAEQQNANQREPFGRAQPSEEEVREALLGAVGRFFGTAGGGFLVGLTLGGLPGAGAGALYGGMVGGAWAVAYLQMALVDRLFDCGGAELGVEYIMPADPNEKVGPAGLETGRFATGDREFQYMVFFENRTSANAPAQEILIVDELDSNFNCPTFSLGDLQIGNEVVPIPEGSQNLTTTLDLRPTMAALVDVTCTFDPMTGRAEWLLRGRDPDTGELADFLPPNTDAVDPLGRGWVSYTVSPKPDLPSGTIIRNTATIDFEVDIPPEPEETPEWVNTIDAGAPSSEILPLKDVQENTRFLVSWWGQDDDGGSGIRDYTIYVATDEGEYEVWLANTADTSATFTGDDGHSYKFCSLATDNVGYVEAAPDKPDAVTRVALPTGQPSDTGSVQEEPGGQPAPPGPAPCGACGAGAPAATLLICCVIGCGKLRLRARRARHGDPSRGNM